MAVKINDLMTAVERFQSGMINGPLKWGPKDPRSARMILVLQTQLQDFCKWHKLDVDFTEDPPPSPPPSRIILQ